MFTQATSCIFPFSLKTGVCFEDCCVVRGGFSAVLPLSHYSLVCHALYSEEEEMKSRGEQQWTDKMMKARHEEMIFSAGAQLWLSLVQLTNQDKSLLKSKLNHH